MRKGALYGKAPNAVESAKRRPVPGTRGALVTRPAKPRRSPVAPPLIDALSSFARFTYWDRSTARVRAGSGRGPSNMATSRSATELLLLLSAGDRDALNELVPLVYEELRAIARRRLRHERIGHTLNTTGLVHEAYLKLIQLDRV